MVIDILSILFLSVIFVLCQIAPKRYRKGILLVSSLLYIGGLDWKALIAVFVTGLITYLFGLGISKQLLHSKGKARLTFIWSLVMSVGVLGLYKYSGVLYGSGLISESAAAALIVPVGFSFYILGSIAYLSDIYMGKRDADKSYVNYMLYMSWFPKFVSGPIESEGAMSEAFDKLAEFRLSLDVLRLALLRIVYGAVLKLVIADRIGIYVDDIYTHMNEFGSVALIVGAIFYSMQIYCDFAGYTFFARGVSLLFGVELSENFLTPYCAENIGEFWRRWHITLSTWLKNYIYIPLGGNRRGELRQAINLLLVFIVSGFWHGATAAFLVWGLLHGIFSVINNKLKGSRSSILTKGMVGRTVTFIEVTFAWIFFRAGSMKVAVEYIHAMFTNGIQWWYIKSYFRESWRQVIDPSLAILFLIIIVVLDVIAYRNKKDIPTLISEKRLWVNLLFIYASLLLIMIFGIYGTSILAKTYIYMQF